MEQQLKNKKMKTTILTLIFAFVALASNAQNIPQTQTLEWKYPNDDLGVNTFSKPDTVFCIFMIAENNGFDKLPENQKDRSAITIKWYQGYIITESKYNPVFTNVYGGRPVKNRLLWADRKTVVSDFDKSNITQLIVVKK